MSALSSSASQNLIGEPPAFVLRYWMLGAHTITHRVRRIPMRIIFTLFCFTMIAVNASQSQWTPSNNGLGDLSVGALFADDDTLYAGTTSGVYKSINSGSSWTLSSNGLPTVTNFFSIVRSGSYLVAGGDGAGIWRSSDYGASWAQTTSGVLSNEYTYIFSTNGNTVYAAFGFPSSVGISTDNGATWTKHNNGISPTYTMTGVVNKADVLFASHGILGVYRSTDNGANWEPANSGITAAFKNALLVSGNNLAVGGSNGLYFSSNNGDSWDQPTAGIPVYGMSGIGAALYAVGQAIHRSTNDGQTWSAIDITDLPGSIFNTLQIAGNYAFVNYFGVGVYRRPLSEITDVRSEVDLPRVFSLEQNYPNPFNPSTKIVYRVKSRGFVELRVFDVLGREVATLVNEMKAPGEYSVTFDASHLSSGVYFYRLKAGDFVQTKKLTLLK